MFRFMQWLTVVVALICSLLLAYGASYFHLSSVVTGGGGTKVRVYEATWMMFLFAPAACVESQITGDEVRVAAELQSSS